MDGHRDSGKRVPRTRRAVQSAAGRATVAPKNARFAPLSGDADRGRDPVADAQS
jgi:hypothetical protein